MRNPTKAVWGAVLALALAWPVPALASPRQFPKLDNVLQDGPADPQNVIVRAKPGRRASVKEKVGRHTPNHRALALIEGVSARLNRRQIVDLANDPDVDGISIDADVTASGKGTPYSGDKHAGVAPGVKILALKVLDKRGSGKTSSVITALAFAVENRARYNIKVINLSLGHPVFESAKTDPLVQAVEAAVRAGIVVVVAAGNYGYNSLTGEAGYAGIASPGNAPSVITVGAAVTNGTVSRADDRLASYSSRGPS